MQPALSGFLYQYNPYIENIEEFLKNRYNSYKGAKSDINNFIKTGILELIYNPTKEDVNRSLEEYKKVIDIYIKIKEEKFLSLGFIIFDH